MKKRLLIVFVLLLTLLCATEHVEAENTKKVRVGYIDYGDFIFFDDRREQAEGYGVGYLNEVINLTNWEIEYVAVNWDNGLKMLREGSIDILCPAQKTKERMDEFLYSEYAAGTTETVIYVVDRKSQLFYEGYEYLIGKNVGVIESSAQQRDFRNFAEKNNITCNEVSFATMSQLQEAADRNEIDAFVTSSLSYYPEYRIIARFDAQPFYFLLGADREVLLEELNEAVGRLKVDNFNFDSDLYKQYYGIRQEEVMPLFTREEYDYIQNAPVITVGLFSGFMPYTDYVEGRMTGICEEFLKEISRRSGLRFNMVPVEPSQNLKEVLLKDNGIDMMAGVVRSQIYLEDSTLQVSNSAFDYTFSVVIKKNSGISTMDNAMIALPKNAEAMASTLTSTYSDVHIMICDNNEACLKAVSSEKADMTVLNEYTCNYLLQKPVFSNLSVLPNLRFDTFSCFVANENTSSLVISIINKTIQSISDSNKMGIINQYVIEHSYQVSFGEMLYKNRGRVFFAAVVILILTIIMYSVYDQKKTAVFEKKQAEELKRQLEISSLTGLYNKHAFYQKAEQLMKEHQEKQYEIILFDIEKFRIINDLFGMSKGDELLRHFADRLKKMVEGTGVAGYRGADNFVVCIEQGVIADIEATEKELYQYINEYPMDIKIQIRIGIYQVTDRNVPVSLMCDRANMAAESVKGNELLHHAYYDASMREKLIHDQEILNEMQEALDQEQFKIFIQPKCRLDNEELTGGEALVRWEHPKRGMLSPGVFVPLFETNGFITKLDYYVWEQTCKCIHEWKAQGLKTVPLSVNVSRLNFYLPGFEDMLDNLLKKYELTQDDLYFEVTESAYTTESDAIFEQLSRLQQKHYTILMDDFGSGYSSLNMLQEAPVDVLKLDMKFLLGNDDKGRSEVIIESVIRMADKLGFKIIAEGVETKEQCDMLLRLGCYDGQGYYFSKPIPAGEFQEKYFC